MAISPNASPEELQYRREISARCDEAGERAKKHYGHDWRERLACWSDWCAEDKIKTDEELERFAKVEPHTRFEGTVMLTINERPQTQWELASRFVSTLPGRIVVEMAEPRTKVGELWLPDHFRDNFRPDVGVVIASGREGVEPGDIVLVRGYDGTWRNGFSAGEYKAVGQVRTFGIWIPPGADGEAKLYDPCESVLAKLGDDMQIAAMTQGNVLVRRDPVLTEEKGILLHSDAGFRTNAGTVEKVHEGSTILAGTRVVYHPFGVLDVECGTDKDLAIVPEDCIEMILTEGEKVTGIRARQRGVGE